MITTGIGITFYAVFRSSSVRDEIVAIFENEEDAKIISDFRRGLGDHDARFYYKVLEAERFVSAEDYKVEYIFHNFCMNEYCDSYHPESEDKCKKCEDDYLAKLNHYGREKGQYRTAEVAA